MTYRNRAAERREFYHQSAKVPVERRVKLPPAGAKTEDYDQPTKNGIGEDNIGNRLLQQMGWSKGEGLGRHGTGIVDPVKAQMYAQGAGLGSGSVMGGVEAGDSTKDIARKIARARFQAGGSKSDDDEDDDNLDS